MRMAGGNFYGSGGSSGMAEQGGSGIFSFLSTLPTWLSALITIAAVIILAWIAGIIIGKLYASIKYPDPNKSSVFSPKQKIIFMGVAAAVIAILFTTLSKSPVQEEPSPESGIINPAPDGGGKGEIGIGIVEEKVVIAG